MATCCLRCTDSLTIGCWESCFAPTRRDYADVAPTLKTGDLFIARANSTGRIAGQYTIGSSPWDHVGIIWVHTDGEVYVIDSGAARYYGFCTRPLHFPEDGACDTEAWDPKGTGVQMYPLATFIEEQGRKPLHVMPGKTPWYYDTIGIRPLATALAPAQQAAMAEAIKQYRDRPYQKDDDNPGEMMNAAIDCCECCWMKNAEEHRDTLFCSELVAAVYMDVGLLPPAKESGLPADEYMPSDFSRDHGCNASSLCCSCWFSWWCGRGCFSWGDIRNYSSNPKGKKQQLLLFQPEIVLESPDAPASLLVAVAVSATDSASSKRASARKKGSAAAAPIHPS